MQRVIVFDRDFSQAEALAQALGTRGFSATPCKSHQELLAELIGAQPGFVIVVLDLSNNLPEGWTTLDLVNRMCSKEMTKRMIVCFSRVYLGPEVRIAVEEKGAKLVYVRLLCSDH